MTGFSETIVIVSNGSPHVLMYCFESSEETTLGNLTAIPTIKNNPGLTTYREEKEMFSPDKQITQIMY